MPRTLTTPTYSSPHVTFEPSPSPTPQGQSRFFPSVSHGHPGHPGIPAPHSVWRERDPKRATDPRAQPSAEGDLESLAALARRIGRAGEAEASLWGRAFDLAIFIAAHFDKPGDGYVTLDEVCAALLRLGVEVDEREAGAMRRRFEDPTLEAHGVRDVPIIDYRGLARFDND
jgi:hypothetical protein